MEDRFVLFDVVMVLLLVGAILAGCAGGAAKYSSIDACKLITQADAEAVLGGSVKAPENPITGEGLAVVTSCKYTVTAAPSLHNVTLIVRRLDNADAAQKDFVKMKKDLAAQPNVTITDVTGSGDAAFWIGGMINQLAVLKGKVQLLIMVSGPRGVAPDAAATTLAAKALTRLP